MSEDKMPAVEVNTSDFDERNSYEFAFHVLPTVAEGEVPGVFEALKAHIVKVGEVISEEQPERVDLEYPIVKQIEGRNRKFSSAYFGWVRFKLEAEKLAALMEELSVTSSLLRHLLIKLTREEEAHPFRFHENKKAVKMVEVVNEEETLAEVHTEEETVVPVSEEALDESLEKITNEGEVKAV
jgi:ribosomal protein S6